MRKFIMLVAAGALFFSVNCQKPVGDNPDFVVLTINGKKISLKELDRALGISPYEVRKQLYNMRMMKLDDLIGENLLIAEASRKGVPVKDLKKEIVGKAELIKNEDVERFFHMAKERNPSLKKEQIRMYLEKRQRVIEEAKFIKNLKENAKIENFISRLEPEIPELDIDIKDEPAKGPIGAKITVVEFTDFECPSCLQGHVTANKVLKDYAGKIRFIRKDFPIYRHRNAMNAHQAANCALDHGKYWEYTEKLWKNRTRLTIDYLKSYAKELGMDPGEFNKCLDSKKYQAEIEGDMKEADVLGLTGVPAFFINGKLLQGGAGSYEMFKEVIDKLL